MIEVNNRKLNHLCLWLITILAAAVVYMDIKWFSDLTLCVFFIPIGICSLYKAATYNWVINIHRKEF